MSFSADVKSELLGKIPKNKCCRLAECTAIFLFCAKSAKKAARMEDFLASMGPSLAGKCFTLAEKSFSMEKVFISANAPLERTRLEKACCKRAFLRGAFLACGSMSDPSKGYHLEFAARTVQNAELLSLLASEFDIDLKISERPRGVGAYVKDSEAIVAMLAVLEASLAVMEMENSRIVKEVRNSVNRKVNCEAANIGKTIAASSSQIDDIRRLKESGHFSALPATLREIAELRLAWPELSLGELGALADPPIGKSGVNHRLRRLAELANEE